MFTITYNDVAALFILRDIHTRIYTHTHDHGKRIGQVGRRKNAGHADITFDDGRWCWVSSHGLLKKIKRREKGGEREIHGHTILHSRHIAVILGVEALARDRLKSTPVHIYASIHHSVKKKYPSSVYLSFIFDEQAAKWENGHTNHHTLSLCLMNKKSHVQSITNMMILHARFHHHPYNNGCTCGIKTPTLADLQHSTYISRFRNQPWGTMIGEHQSSANCVLVVSYWENNNAYSQNEYAYNGRYYVAMKRWYQSYRAAMNR